VSKSSVEHEFVLQNLLLNMNLLHLNSLMNLNLL
jgi:hypothetical protein